MSKLPHLPLFIDAIESDCGYMTDQEFGIYMRILMLMWKSPNCQIPADIEWIAKRLRLTPLEFSSIAKPILDEFCKIETDANALQVYVQKRLKKEYDYVTERVAKRRKAAEARWGIDNKEENSMQMHNKCNAPTPIPTPKYNNRYIYARGCKYDKETAFDLFWGVYPNVRPKGNKAKAKEIFFKLFKNGVVDETFIKRCEEYKRFCESGNYNQHATTWLNQSGWETEWANQISTADDRPQQGNRRGQTAGGIDQIIDTAEKAKEMLRRQAAQSGE